MSSNSRKRKAMETIAGAAIGAAIAGPVGAVAGGLAASKVDSGGEPFRRRRRAKISAEDAVDDPLVHVWLRRILVPLDFSPPSQQAMRFAREWATIFGAEVFLLHVIEPSASIVEFGTVSTGMVRRALPARAKAALEEVAGREFPDSIPVTVSVREGKAFDQIAAAAREMRADLIIIATHGHGGLKHVLLGSTAERVAQHASCPVLVLRRSGGG